MRYKIINEYARKGEVLSDEAKIAMDIVDSHPPGTPLQVLYEAAHRKVLDSEKRRLIKVEIMILLNRKRGIESTRADYIDEEFPLDNEIRDILLSMREVEQSRIKRGKKLNELRLRIKFGIRKIANQK